MPGLPLGTSDFQNLRRAGSLYVDKSGAVARVVTGSTLVTLFCRPRRFGKTLFLSTLRYFWEQSEQPRQALFEDLSIWKDPTAREHFQRYPVIWLSFKEVRGLDWESARAGMLDTLTRESQAFAWLEEHPALSTWERARLRVLLSGQAELAQWRSGLLDLSRMLQRATGRPVVVLIDEYDTPVHSAWQQQYYEQMVDFLRSFLGTGLKDNPALHKAVLTGILRVAREGMFSSLNHLDLRSVLEQEDADAFGFSDLEVQALATAVQSPHQMEQLRTWYNGYCLGGRSIYNPWSVLACLSHPGDPPGPYWVNTGSIAQLSRHIFQGDRQLLADMLGWLSGEALLRPIPDATPLPGMGPAELRALLLHAGYLTAEQVHRENTGWKALLRVPNRDVRAALLELVQQWWQQAQPEEGDTTLLLRAMLSGETELFAELLGSLVLRALSVYDVAGAQPERVYHAFVLGLTVHLEGSHQVWSNVESGEGRPDVMLLPRQAGGVGVLLEFKQVRNEKGLSAAMEAGHRQLRERRYDTRLREADVSKIYSYIIVFCGKRLWMEREEPGDTL